MPHKLCLIALGLSTVINLSAFLACWMGVKLL